MSDMLGIGINSLMTFQQALIVSSQNAANDGTPYYARRVVNFEEGMLYGGVNIGDISRIYDSVASRRLSETNSLYSYYGTYSSNIMPFEALLEDKDSSIGNFLDSSIKALETANANANGATERKGFVNQLNFLCARFNDLSEQVALQKRSAQDSMKNILNNINNITQKIAGINDDLKKVDADQVPSLLDQRELLIQTLSTYTDIQVLRQDRDQVSVMIGNGFTLVDGNKAYTLNASNTSSNTGDLEINALVGTNNIPITNLVSAGQLGGLMAYIKQTLTTSENNLSRLAIAIADAFNQQNKLGMDANGNIGGNIFNDINSASMMINRVIANTANTGTEDMSVRITDPSLLTNYDYSLTFDTTNHYIITRTTDNTLVASGALGALPQQINMDGFSLNINSGTIVAGDRFFISPTRGGASAFATNLSQNTVDKLALAWPVSAAQNVSNSGNGAIKVTSITDTTTSAFSTPGQLTPPIRIEFISATSYQLVDTITSTVIEGPIAYNPATGADIFPTPGSYDPGYRISITGEVAAGDSFNINYNSEGISDNRNGYAMTKLYSKNTVESGFTFNQAYRFMVSTVATQANGVNNELKTSGSLLSHAKAQYEQISSVDKNEEAVNLARYQQAFQASAQIIEVAKSLFDTIINMTRR